MAVNPFESLQRDENETEASPVPLVYLWLSCGFQIFQLIFPYVISSCRCTFQIHSLPLIFVIPFMSINMCYLFTVVYTVWELPNCLLFWAFSGHSLCVCCLSQSSGHLHWNTTMHNF